MALRILVADKLAEEGLEFLKSSGMEFDVKVGLSDDELAAAVPAYDAMIVRSAPKKGAISKALQNPGKLTYASTGIGSVAHLSVELFKILTGTSMVHVPYRGNAPALTDLLAGNVDLTIDVSSSVASHLKSGALRSLGATTASRTSFDPDMPTVAETVPGFEAFSWNGIVVRAGTPPAIIDKVGRDFAHAVRQPQAKEALARILMEPVGSSSAEFLDLIRADAARWERVVSAINLNPQQK